MRARRQIVFASALAVALGLLAVALTSPRSGWGRALSRKSFDLLQVVQLGKAEVSGSFPVVLVYLDVDSHRELGQDPAGRWDRRLHTQLLQRLTMAGAKAVVFDVVFDRPWPDPAVDQAFADAIRAHGRVVLAAERHRTDRAPGQVPAIQVQGWSFPTPLLRDAAAQIGAAEMAVDDDFVVRRLLRWVDGPERPGLAWATLMALGASASAAESSVGDEWTRYYGFAMRLPNVAYRTALEPAAVPDAFFRDKVVFVGSRPMAGVFAERRDELRHPLSFWGEPDSFMPAVEVHATQLTNWLHREALLRVNPVLERAIAVIVGIVLAMMLEWFRPLAGALSAIAVAAASAAAAGILWSSQGYWFSWLAEAAVLVPAGWSISMVHHGLDWHRQRRRLEAQRREDRKRIERQAALIDKARDFIVVTNLDGQILHANPAAARVLRVTPTAVSHPPGPPSEPVHAVIPGFAEIRERLLAEGEWSGAMEAPDRAGKIRIVECRWTSIRDEKGKPEAILMIGSDVTEKRRLEVDFLRAQKWETVGSLAGGMAHDLNNRLAPALLGLQLLQESALDENTLRMLATIESHTRLGAETVRQVLRFLRGDAVEFAEIRPSELVRTLESLVRETFPKTVRVGSLIAPRAGRVRGNPTQLEQALLNLCLNARDAMPDGGELTLAVDDVDLPESEAASLRGGRAGAYVLIAVSDSGTGIAPENLERIFDPLFTTKPEGKGTGLGLASVARVVEQHGGCLGVTTELGAGTTFEIYLPRIPDPNGSTT